MVNSGYINGGLPNGGLPNGGLHNDGTPNGGLPNGGLPNGGLRNGELPNGGLHNDGLHDRSNNKGVTNNNNEKPPNGKLPNGGLNNNNGSLSDRGSVLGSVNGGSSVSGGMRYNLRDQEVFIDVFDEKPERTPMFYANHVGSGDTLNTSNLSTLV